MIKARQAIDAASQAPLPPLVFQTAEQLGEASHIWSIDRLPGQLAGEFRTTDGAPLELRFGAESVAADSIFHDARKLGMETVGNAGIAALGHALVSTVDAGGTPSFHLVHLEADGAPVTAARLGALTLAARTDAHETVRAFVAVDRWGTPTTIDLRTQAQRDSEGVVTALDDGFYSPTATANATISARNSAAIPQVQQMVEQLTGMVVGHLGHGSKAGFTEQGGLGVRRRKPHIAVRLEAAIGNHGGYATEQDARSVLMQQATGTVIPITVTSKGQRVTKYVPFRTNDPTTDPAFTKGMIYAWDARKDGGPASVGMNWVYPPPPPWLAPSRDVANAFSSPNGTRMTMYHPESAKS